MFKFFKRKQQSDILEFVELEQHPDKDKYFYRTKKWFWLTEREIGVIDPPRFITMDPWPQQVFLDAIGGRTVKEYVYFLASKYTGEVPAELAKTVIYQIEKLLHEEKIIALSGGPVNIEPELLNPSRMGK